MKKKRFQLLILSPPKRTWGIKMKRIVAALLLLFCLLSLVSCEGKQEDKTRTYSVYYVSNAETKIEMHTYEIVAEDLEGQVTELMTALATTPAKLEYKAPLSGSFQLLDYTVGEDQLTLSFDEN